MKTVLHPLHRTLCVLRTAAVVAAAVLAAILTTSVAARAEVVEKSPHGFLIHNSAVVKGAPAQAYAAFLRIGEWWTPSHTYSGVSANLSLDANAGGCFCETLPNGGSARHLEVVFVAPGSLIRMTGGLGPLQGHGVAGSMTYSFTVRGDSTVIDQAYSVGGYFKGGLDKFAPVVNTVLGEMLASLQSFVDTGKPKW